MIEFQFFDGCPNSKATLANIEELISEGLIAKEELKITEVPTMELAERYNFQGSPSVLMDGVDIYTGEKPTGFSYNCRVYKIDGKHTGILSKEFIRSKISTRP
jgi:hypothetical protein